MAPIDTLRTRLNFIRIDDEARATIRELKPLIARVLPGILDGFYAHVAKYQDVARLFADNARIRHAKDMQIKHWDQITSAVFDDAYVASITAISKAHSRLGLEPRWYIGGYAFLISELLRVIELEIDASAGWSRNTRRASQEKKAKMLSALSRAALLDMDFAISVYLETGLTTRQESLDRVGATFYGIIATVSSAATELEATAGALTHTAELTQRLSTSVAAASEEASSNVQSVASATEELGSSVNEISRQVQESSRIAGEAVRQAEATDARIAQLSQAASRIGDVVKLITAIAEQTNLLALNATIEAARAGEAGRGFAVVASEVKALASQTAKATEDISTQISSMQSATRESVAAIKEIGTTISRISEIAATVAAAVEEQGGATQEIAKNVQRAARGTAEVASNIVEVNRGAAETGSASGEVLAAAGSLAGESTRLKDEIENFLNTFRAA
jgi:methyl-accepting chemotaxis protein